MQRTPKIISALTIDHSPLILHWVQARRWLQTKLVAIRCRTKCSLPVSKCLKTLKPRPTEIAADAGNSKLLATEAEEDDDNEGEGHIGRG